MKVRYIGDSFGVCGLTNGKIYTCTGIHNAMLSIIDDEEFDDEGYLYSIKDPGSNDGLYKGKWEIVEDSENKDLEKAFKKYI